MLEQLRLLVSLILLLVRQLRMHDLLRHEVDLLRVSWRVLVPHQKSSAKVAPANAPQLFKLFCVGVLRVVDVREHFRIIN